MKDFSDYYDDIVSQIVSFRSEAPDGMVMIRWVTATGKTALSLRLAQDLDVSIVSADSRQIFRLMDIATDKIYLSIREKIPHYLIDIVNPDESYTAGARQRDAKDARDHIQGQGRIPLVVWGTGLYLDTLYKNYTMPDAPPNWPQRDRWMQEEALTPWILHQRLLAIDPQEAAKLHPKATRFIVRALEIYEYLGVPKTEAMREQPVDKPLLMIGLRREKDDSEMRIRTRIEEMIDRGLVAEVQGLLDAWYSPDLQSMQGIGYKEIASYLAGNVTYQQAIDAMIQATNKLAKRQRTRLRRYKNDGLENPKANVTYHIYELS